MKKIVLLAFALVLLSTVAFNIQPVKAEPETVRVDNLIVTTSDLEAAATRLAQWKNSCGIPSKVLDVTWIYSHYSGVDEPEKIRNCIKDFHSNFQTKYVTIFGDTDKVPIRYVYVPDKHETYVPTDLYYADLDYTWDDNGDGLYADLDNDLVDGVPDVYVGRIPSSFVDTAEDVVTKIIQYKQFFDISEDWVSRVVLAAGVDDGLEGATTDISEYISDVVSDKNVVKLYESAGNLTNHALDYEIDRGCIFLSFAGHSREEFWSSESWVLRYIIPWVLPEVYSWEDALDRTNGRKLPVIVTMSCLSAKVDEEECIAEYFVLNPNGGAIAYFGSTRVAWSYTNGSAPYGLMGEMDRRIFEAFYDGYTRLGDMWGVSLTEYLQHHQLDYYFEGNGYLNEKTVMEFILLGDPTLRIYNGPETLEVQENYATIQGAVNVAYDEDRILVSSGTYHEHVIVNKRISLVGEDRSTTIIDGGGFSFVVMVHDTDHVHICGFTILNGYYEGVFLLRSSYCNVSGNIVRTMSSEGFGIELGDFSTNNDINNNVVMTNYRGIILQNNCSRNIIVGNKIFSNSRGISLLLGCEDNIISTNMISDNYNGIQIHKWSSNNVILNNTISNSEHYGVDVFYHCYWNIFYHNNFINNINQAKSYESKNIWDNGYPSGGNYWSDYTSPPVNGVDIKSGFNQDETGSDAIGDTPYLIDANNIDHYPLMNPWSPLPTKTFDIVADSLHLPVSILSNSTVSHFVFDQEQAQIRFKVTGEFGTTDYCSVIIPKELLWGEFSVYKDGSLLVKNVDYTQTYNGTHYTFYITYIHSTHTIEISGTEVIPEFPTWTSMILILIVLTVAIAIYKRRLLKTQIH